MCILFNNKVLSFSDIQPLNEENSNIKINQKVGVKQLDFGGRKSRFLPFPSFSSDKNYSKIMKSIYLHSNTLHTKQAFKKK